MKKDSIKKYIILIVLVIIIVIEIITLSCIIITKKNKEKQLAQEVINLEQNFIENNKTSNSNIAEEIIAEIHQASIENEQREKEQKAKRKEILQKRKALLAEEAKKNNTNSTNPVTDKIAISKILNGKLGNINYTSKLEDLGIPLIQKYPTQTVSRNVWDMQTYNNRIYIGSGDYDANTGPVDVYYYDTEKNQFINEATLQDEQINRFVIVDNELIITGTDPKKGWDYGSYFVWKDNNWTENRTLLGGIHNFDLVKYHGKLFAGIGNDSDSSIVMSSDGGKTFSYVYMYADENTKVEVNSETSGTHRIYDLMEHKDKLYALGYNVVYEYKENENIFVKINNGVFLLGSWYGKAPGLGKYVPLKTKLEFAGNAIFINGSIKYTDDLSKGLVSLKQKEFDNTEYKYSAYVYDAIIINGELNVLCATPITKGLTIENGYIISVYKTKDFEGWEPVLYFEYKDFARSFEYCNGYYYFGIGTKLEETDDGTNSGRILRVKI